jgi:hypothetical protein
MARSTKQSDRKIWVAFRHKISNGLVVQGFSDTLLSEDGETFVLSESAESKIDAFTKTTPGSVILEKATTAEHAIELANGKGI